MKRRIEVCMGSEASLCVARNASSGTCVLFLHVMKPHEKHLPGGHVVELNLVQNVHEGALPIVLKNPDMHFQGHQVLPLSAGPVYTENFGRLEHWKHPFGLSAEHGTSYSPVAHVVFFRDENRDPHEAQTLLDVSEHAVTCFRKLSCQKTIQVMGSVLRW